jgi:hypothetical protein
MLQCGVCDHLLGLLAPCFEDNYKYVMLVKSALCVHVIQTFHARVERPFPSQKEYMISGGWGNFKCGQKFS